MSLYNHIVFDVTLFQTLTSEQAWHYRIIPKAGTGEALSFWIDEVQDADQVATELEMLFDQAVQLDSLASEHIQQALSQYYRKTQSHSNTPQQSQVLSKSDDFLDNLISEAKTLGSSDIHIEPYQHHCRIRIRIDGLLVERYKIKKDDFPGLVNKIKIKANLDIAEKRLPQDGRIHYIYGSSKFDIRVSCLPTLHGEKIVMRLLSNDASKIDIYKLGFHQAALDDYLEGIKKPNGIVLISGPTGSGKTTTLYASLRLLNKETRNILTIEDPIEYTLEGINQVQLRENIGLNFASTLRTFLRQDPDVIMVGEIRDKDTAAIAIRAALTGHLVLSTIHTNKAWGIIARLVDMGIPAFLIADTLNLAVAQRLLRLLCPHCKRSQKLDSSLLPRGFTPPFSVHQHAVAVGCEQCYFTGYKGRTAIYEVIPITESVVGAIKQGKQDLPHIQQLVNYTTLATNAFQLFSEQKTSLEEIYAVLNE